MATRNSGRIAPSARTVLLFCATAAVFICTDRTPAGGQTKEPPSTAQGQPPANELDRTFTLEEVSLFDLDDQQVMGLRLGHWVRCTEAPDPNVVAYPTFKSQHPLYGTLSLPYPPDKQSSSTAYRFAIDESGTTGQGYDRLYFDLNHDGDLTNDKILAVPKDPADRPILGFRGTQQVCFETVAIPLPFDAQSSHPLELMPRLMGSPNGKVLGFVATKARKGQIQLGDRKYDVLLGHVYVLAGWFDNPRVTLYVVPAGGERFGWGDGNPLAYTQKINGTFYRFSATPAGDKLTVHPYAGPLGTLEVGPGDRKIGTMLISGSLRTATTTVPLGIWVADGRPLEPARSCKLPVGDYRLDHLTVQMDGLSAVILNNYYSDGKPMDKRNRQNTYGIAIREDKPFVLEFSSKPQVLFALPASDHRVKRGQELSVKAVLIDPALDVMFRYLKQGQQLDPKVTITRANGEIVAQGVMPFGSDGTRGYSWRVPNDLTLNGNGETFTITVTYDTRDLYGTVIGNRELVVYRQ